jgi:hypothetical protein
MRIHLDLRSVLLLGTVCWATAGSLSRAAPSDPDAADEKSVKIGEVWQASEVWQLPILRLAVSESTVDDATRRKATEALLKYESQLRQMIADAQKDPSQAANVLEKLRAFQGQQNAAIQSLFNKDQWEQIGKLNSSLALQLTALSSDPQSFMAAIDKRLKLTAEQKAKIDPTVARMAAKLKSLKADLKRADVPAGTHAKIVIEEFDGMVSASIDARAEIRKALTPDQLRRFDSGITYGPSNEVEKPKEGAHDSDAK